MKKSIRASAYLAMLLFITWSQPTIASEPVFEYKGVQYFAGDTLYGFKNYVKLVVGDASCPLMLGIPHDGVQVGSPEIPETGKTGRDINTRPFTLALAKAFQEDTGLQPWIIINEIHRKRVDPNTYPKDVESRYSEDSDARRTYDSYHELLTLAHSTMAKKLQGKGGLFIDMHGHARKYTGGQKRPYTSITSGKTLSSAFIDHSELGYGLSSEWVSQPDDSLNRRAPWSSVAAIALAHPEVSFSALIRGPYSLGTLLQSEGVISVPSTDLPILERDAALFGRTSAGEARRRPYFNGGYVTRRYGSATKGRVTGLPGGISCIQIETPGITVRNNASVYSRSSQKFKRALIEYLNHWYGYDFSNRDYPYDYH